MSKTVEDYEKEIAGLGFEFVFSDSFRCDNGLTENLFIYFKKGYILVFHTDRGKIYIPEVYFQREGIDRIKYCKNSLLGNGYGFYTGLCAGDLLKETLEEAEKAGGILTKQWIKNEKILYSCCDRLRLQEFSGSYRKIYERVLGKLPRTKQIFINYERRNG